MVKDRLIELRKVAGVSGKIHSDESDSLASPSENSAFLTNSDWTNIDTFLNKVGGAIKQLEQLESILPELKRLHNEILRSPGTDPSLIQKLNDINDDFTTLSKQTNSNIKLITEDANKTVGLNTGETRIKKNQAFTLKKRLGDILVEFNTEQVQYRERCKASMKNYLKCVNNEMTEDEIEEAVESGKLYSTKSIMLGDREKQMLLRDVESRHQDIIKLEKSIAELHEMFQDIAMLVDAQGDIIDNIEMNVNTAAQYTQQAHKNVVDAKNLKRRNLKHSSHLLPMVTRMISTSLPNSSASTAVKSGLEKYRAKLLYQSLKRGILENDIILGGFAREHLPSMSEEELVAYDKIINAEHMEWDLFYYVSEKKPPPPELEHCKVFHKIKDYVKNSKGLERH